MSGNLPTVITSAGLQPQTPAALRAQLLAAVSAVNPGYTANLPGSLIEDISSTDVYAITLCDAARVETVNSLTPYAANDFTLNQLGQIYGVPLGRGSTTSVYVVFSGPAGFVVPQGFTVSDGTYQYILQEGGIIGTDGQSTPLYALSTTQGSWAVPANTVTQLVTSVPSTISLTATNPTAGVPGTSAQTAEDYRAQVLQAGRAISQGMATTLRTYLGNVPGVQNRLVSVRQLSGGWEIIVGGGDPYQVANAIWTALFDTSTLTGSVMSIENVTNANPGVVTTVLNHGYTTGQVVHFAGLDGTLGTELNGLTTGPITVITEKTFSFGVDTTGFATYSGGGYLTPNLRNVSVSINDFPDTFDIVFVNPPQQTVALAVTWNSTAPNIVSPVAVAQLAIPALVEYINGIYVGQPINLYELQATFQQAVASIIPTPLLTRMVFAVSINGVGVSAEAGTGIIAGDPESYFYTTAASITVNQG